MKRLMLLLLVLSPLLAFGQGGNNFGSGVLYSNGTPTTCTLNTLIVDSTTGTTYWCNAGVPTVVAGGGGGGGITTTGSPVATNCAIFSGATSITGTGDCIFAAGALSLGKAGTSTGIMNLLGTISGTDSFTPNATATVMTLGGALGQIAIPNGSVGTPSFVFGDATTGLYRAGANQVGIAASGTMSAIFAAGSVTFINGTLLQPNVITGNLTLQGFDGSPSAATWGAVLTRGGNVNAGATTGAIAGARVDTGGDNLATGATETAGDSGRRPGIVSSATPTTANNGRFNDSVVGIKGTTITTGHLACVSGTAPTTGFPGVYSDCSTTALALNWVGVVRTINGNAAIVQIAGDATVASNASASWTAGWTACVDQTNAGFVTATSTTACAAGQGVGIVSFTDTSQTSHTIVMHPR